VIMQVGVGIATLTHAAPISLSLIHQSMAVLLLTAAVLHAQRLGRAQS
jgi:heme a synthase